VGPILKEVLVLERSRIQMDCDLTSNYLKEARRKSREVNSTSCPQEGHLQSTDTTRGAGLWSGGQAKGPLKGSKESSIASNLWGIIPTFPLQALRTAALIPGSGLPIQDQGHFPLPGQGTSYDQNGLLFGLC